jgi:hypothetical protein
MPRRGTQEAYPKVGLATLDGESAHDPIFPGGTICEVFLIQRLADSLGEHASDSVRLIAARRRTECQAACAESRPVVPVFVVRQTFTTSFHCLNALLPPETSSSLHDRGEEAE